MVSKISLIPSPLLHSDVTCGVLKFFSLYHFCSLFYRIDDEFPLYFFVFSLIGCVIILMISTCTGLGLRRAGDPVLYSNLLYNNIIIIHRHACKYFYIILFFFKFTVLREHFYNHRTVLIIFAIIYQKIFNALVTYI